MYVDGTQERLYVGAILVTQAAHYGGIYDDVHGCSLIEFGGRSGIRGPAASTYPDPESFLPEAITADGNPA